jgi:hypothetical protein
MKNKEILIEDAIQFHEEQVKVCSEKMTRALFGEERCEELKDDPDNIRANNIIIKEINQCVNFAIPITFQKKYMIVTV